MEYTIKKLAQIAGVSTRTLRYYDEIGILKPARINSSGYRIYGQKETDRLQNILFYRELGVELDKIGEFVNDPAYDCISALQNHRGKLLEKKNQLEQLIKTIDKTIAANEGRTEMTDKEKFEGFKQNILNENDRKYGEEIREKYGEEFVNKSYDKFKGMSEEQYKEFEELTALVRETLNLAFETGDPAGELAQKAADLHRQWLSFSWPRYSGEAHAGLAQMYVDDERFRAYYDREQPGMAEFLRDAILVYTGKKG
ncbi:transcriptional regulator, MerR family [Ruminiclostridium papyrosolvens DSM 2782]|uniref:Transcriptional regulator, MerR family n=1 Tax=Ruminiclostridium papyrosolvens DSM 2782 TaxID=588581 RepID=F1T9V3_9FIRM|nr:MerR family transcriptional regulator [Ruminiclostridium papyrosolvens]EGD48695.1 transcriptional regulator, MerR family [Ruminiclostridium papyrosolvens DSM 2782]WES32548.1 MerR family transcriptional regulator [Ruminiclostridium papyrosolvens DSM 2782]